MSYASYLRHPMFRLVRDIVMRRDGGTCRDCDMRATETHHLRYPPWGTFDLPSNLVALCHACHAKRHGKDPRV
jgi:5-methylcytosine-specific restriction endonuclease McrA